MSYMVLLCLILPQMIWCILLELYLFALFFFLVLKVVYLQSPSLSLVLGWFVIIFELNWCRDDIILIPLHHSSRFSIQVVCRSFLGLWRLKH